MPSWDRSSRSGGDSGGDKPLKPGIDPYHPSPPTSETTAHSRAHHERAESARQNSSDKPAVSKPEETEQADKKADRQGDQGTDKNGEATKGIKEIFERQDALIGTQERQIGRLTSVIGQRDRTIDSQAMEIDRLRAQLAKNDQPGGDQNAVRTPTDNREPPPAPERPRPRVTGDPDGGGDGPNPPPPPDGPDDSSEGTELPALLKRIKDLEAERAEKDDTIADLWSVNARQDATIARQGATITQQGAEISGLKAENAKLGTEVVDLRAANKERDWQDRARDGKIAEQAKMLEALQAAVGELARNKDQPEAQAQSDGKGVKERALSGETRASTVEKQEHKRHPHVPSDAKNALIAALAEFATTVDHPPHTTADWIEVGAAGLTVIATGVATGREHRKDKNGDENH